MGNLSISKIWARGFRSLDNFSLDLGPFNVLVGRNGSGKSNIIDILKFISDAFYVGIPTALNMRGGPRELLNVSGGERASQFTVGLQARKDQFIAEYELTIQALTRNRVAVREERIWLQIKDRVSEIVVNNGRITKLELNPAIRRALTRIRERAAERSRNRAGAGTVYTPMLSLIGDQPTFAGLITSWLFPQASPEQAEEIADAVLEFSFALGEMRFYRIFPDYIREPQPIGVMDSLEEDGSNFASVLRGLSSGEKNSADRVNLAIGKMVPGISGVRVSVFGGTQIVSFDHFDPENPGSKWRLGISQESDGTVRALALLVALHQNPAPSLMAIEEPELGIHSGALQILADLLERSSDRSQMIVATQSSDLLDFLAPESIDSVKAVAMVKGATVAGPVASHQLKAIKEELFTTGYINRIQGLEFEGEYD